MIKKRILSFSAIGVAVIAIVVGLCFVFLGNKSIKDIPKSLSVQQIDDRFFLVADFNSQYYYNFKLEQYLDEEFVLIETVLSSKNTLDLSKQNLDILAGKIFRFSVCFATENGGGGGKFSQTINWQPSWSLPSIDYSSVGFDDKTETLTWNSVKNADYYELRFLDLQGNVHSFSTTNESFNLSLLATGKYRCFVVARSNNEFVFDSVVGDGIEIVLSRKNVIERLERTENGVLKICSSLQVKEFEVFVNGKIRATLLAEKFDLEGDLFVYEFDINSILKSMDFENNIVQIKSLQNEFVLESDFFDLI